MTKPNNSKDYAEEIRDCHQRLEARQKEYYQTEAKLDHLRSEYEKVVDEIAEMGTTPEELATKIEEKEKRLKIMLQEVDTILSAIEGDQQCIE